MSTNWFDQIGEGSGEVLDIADELSQLARSFGQTGNSAIANRLFEVGDRLRASSKTIQDACRAKVHSDFEVVQKTEGVNNSGLKPRSLQFKFPFPGRPQQAH